MQREGTKEQSRIMDTAIEDIKKRGITDEFEIVRILMEQAEKQTTDGEKKKDMVVETYVKLLSQDEKEDGEQKRLKMIPINTIVLIINAFVYITKTGIEINKKTNAWEKVKEFFSKIFKKA